MTCAEHESTLLWIYGEGDDDHAEHLATCAGCQALLAEHADVAAMVAPIASALRARPAALQQPPRRSWPRGGIAGAALLAAAALLAVVSVPQSISEAEDTAAASATMAAAPFADELDAELEELDDELDALFDDLQTL